MRILIACEESQAVCTEMRRMGHEAYSCDIEPCSGWHPEWHIMQDVLPLLNGGCSFRDMQGGQHRIKGRWDMIIAHPPCTYLTASGNAWFNEEKYGDKARERKSLRESAAQFFMRFVKADCERIAIENPIGYMNTHFRKPDCIISPHMFGDPVRKQTCLWLKGLPPLRPTDIVDFDIHYCNQKTGQKTYSGAAFYALDENGKAIPWNDPRTKRIRSRTYHGIAVAMAEQWAGENKEGNK